MKAETNTRNILCVPMAIAAVAIFNAQAEIIYQHSFSGDPGTNINGTAPTTRPGSETWLHRGNFDSGKGASWAFHSNGAFGGAVGSTTDWDANATLPFTPEQGKQYALDISFTGVSRTSTSYGGQDWLGVGFVGSTHIEGNFEGTSGGAWMKINMAGSNSGNHQIALKNSGSGTTYQTWTAGPTGGGDLDLRMILDTTGGAGNWTVTWLAKLPADSSYTTVNSPSDVLDEDITRVGFSIASHSIGGTIGSIQLSSIPTATATTTTLVSSANPASLGSNVTFTATVRNEGVPATDATGTITFEVDGSPAIVAAVVNGVATYSTSSLAVGNRTINAIYSGDTVYDGSSNSLLQTITDSPYNIWADGYELVGGPDDDDDGDGMTNFQEFAFGLVPTSGASVNPITDVSKLKTLSQFSYTRNANSGLTYTIWTSVNLIQWDEAAGSSQEADAPDEITGVQTVLVEVNPMPGGGKVFVRVMAD